MGANDAKLRKAIGPRAAWDDPKQREVLLATVRTALERGASLKLYTKEWTPLHHAVFYSHPDIIRVLLEHGADPNARTKDTRKFTPLIMALQRPATLARAIVLALFEHGARLDVKNGYDQTVLEYQKNDGVGRGVDLKKLYKLAKSGKSAKPEPKKASMQAKTLAMIDKYIGKKVTAKLDGALFDHVPATFQLVFADPKKLWSRLSSDYADEVDGWDPDTVVPMASVCFGKSDIAWLFMDWRGKKPKVLVTTTDDWGDSRTVKSLAALRLK